MEADLILVLSLGHGIEPGTSEKLLAPNDLYASLYLEQFSDEERIEAPTGAVAGGGGGCVADPTGTGGHEDGIRIGLGQSVLGYQFQQFVARQIGKVVERLDFMFAESDEDRRRHSGYFCNLVRNVQGFAPLLKIAVALGELANDPLRQVRRAIGPSDAQIVLFDGSDRWLPSHPDRLSFKALPSHDRFGDTTLLNSCVTDVPTPSANIQSVCKRVQFLT